MNPEKGQFEPLHEDEEDKERQKALREILHPGAAAFSEQLSAALLRPDGSPVPPHWPIFTVGELVTVKDHTFRVAYISEKTLLLEPVPLEVEVK